MITSQEKREITLQAKSLATWGGKRYFFYTPERLEYFKKAFSRYTDSELWVAPESGTLNGKTIIELRRL